MPESETVCYNMNICGIVNRLNRYITEQLYSQSANTNNFNSHDVERCKQYLTNLTSYVDWVVGQPIQDLPKTTPQPYVLAPMVEVFQVSNEMITDVVNYMSTLRDEVVLSQSSRQSTGIQAQDENRIRSMIKAMEDFLSGYVESANPVDMPESSPAEPMVEQSKKK
ncbi:MAG: hypothetical protein ABIK92_21710 [Pseudomonadota bacterium]